MSTYVQLRSKATAPPPAVAFAGVAFAGVAFAAVAFAAAAVAFAATAGSRTIATSRKRPRIRYVSFGPLSSVPNQSSRYIGEAVAHAPPYWWSTMKSQ